MNHARVEELCPLIRGGRWVTPVWLFSVMGRDSHWDYVVATIPVTSGKLLLPLFLIDGPISRVVSQISIDFGIERAQSAKEARGKLWFRKGGALLANKQMIFMSYVLNEASFARKHFSFFDQMKTHISCCHLFAQNSGS